MNELPFTVDNKCYWKSPKGYPEFEVSLSGSIRRSASKEEPPTFAQPEGHLSVSVGGGKRMYLHRLVHLAFLGPLEDGLVVMHLDGDPQNNAFDNLRQGTTAENNAMTKEHGNSCTGESNGMSCLTEEQVYTMRQMAEYFSGHALAKFFNTTASTVHRAINRLTWDHLPVQEGDWKAGSSRKANLASYGHSTLNENKVREIKQLFTEGFTNPELAELFGVQPAAISKIRVGRTWSHV